MSDDPYSTWSNMKRFWSAPIEGTKAVIGLDPDKSVFAPLYTPDRASVPTPEALRAVRVRNFSYAIIIGGALVLILKKVKRGK